MGWELEHAALGSLHTLAYLSGSPPYRSAQTQATPSLNNIHSTTPIYDPPVNNP